jgi:beta-xylosidase
LANIDDQNTEFCPWFGSFAAHSSRSLQNWYYVANWILYLLFASKCHAENKILLIDDVGNL